MLYKEGTVKCIKRLVWICLGKDDF